MNPPPLILASTSPHRRRQMQVLQLSFQTRAPGIDETPLPGEDPAAYVARLAQAKAAAVAGAEPEAVVIGADQAAVLEKRIIGKPGDLATARAQLAALAGRRVMFLSAVHVIGAGLDEGETIPTEVEFRTLDAATIARYLAREMALDCAAGFKSEGLGITLCRHIRSTDPSALIGLPLIALAKLLRRAGYLIP